MKRLIAVASLLLAASCTESADDRGWREVHTMDGGFITIVEVNSDRISDPSIYRDAASRLCGPSSQCFQLAFFQEGAPFPREASRGDFFRSGGWEPYDELALFMGRSQEFTAWDCARIGPEGAPAGALCGEGVAEAYDAALTLGARVGFTAGCGMPATDDESLFRRYADTQGPRRKQLIEAFDSMKASTSDGPDDPSRCPEVSARNEVEARAARTLIARTLASGT